MKLQRLRKNRNLSQEQLAQMSGLNVRTIQRVEKGTTPSMETLKCLASALDIEISEISSETQKSSRAHLILPYKKIVIFMALASIFVLFGAKSEFANPVAGAVLYCCAAICFIISAFKIHKTRNNTFVE